MEELPEALPRAPPTTSAERMRALREKTKLIDQKAYVRPLIEVAKDRLRLLEDPSIDILLEDPEMKAGLDSGQAAQLKTFIKNLRAQRKRDEAASIEKEKEELNIKEKAQRIGNLEISELDRILLDAPSEDDRIDLMRKKIDENIFVFCEYMEILKPRTENFLKHIVGFYGELDETKFTMLFVRVCVMHRGEKLEIHPDMVLQTMKFLVDAKHHPTAALGLLKLTYENQIALTSFPMDFLLKFQVAYENQIIHFIKSLSRVKQHVVESLPPTLFIFTKPLLNTLMAGGEILYVGVPPQFLPYIISILAYTFDSQPGAYESFLQVFKEGCNKLYDTLIYSDFQNLLQVLIEQAKLRSTKYFMQLESTTSAISKSFSLLTEKRISKFDCTTVNQLVYGGEEVMSMMQQKPKIIQSSTLATIESLICSLVKENAHIDFDVEQLIKPLTEEDLLPFRGLGISSLLTIQELAFKIVRTSKQASRIFFRYETGQGKTALCIALAATFALHGDRVLVVNNSPELTFRDFKKALPLQRDLSISIRHTEDTDSLGPHQCDVIYMSGSTFKAVASIIKGQDCKNTSIILDEFDSLLFFNGEDPSNLIGSLKKFEKIYGFSGSCLQIQHQKYIEDALNGQFVHLQVSSKDKIDTVCRSVEVYQKSKDYHQAIIQLVISQTNLTPVVLIINHGFDQLMRQLTQNKIRVENFNSKPAPYIEASMGQFALKSIGRFGVFIINHEQGRGIDFPSSTEIERSGGVYVIIASLPSNFLSYQQFIGRTGRIGNLGQYSVILLDKEAKNIGSEDFHRKRLEELKNKDIQLVSKLIQNLVAKVGNESIPNADDAHQYEEEKEPIGENPNGCESVAVQGASSIISQRLLDETLSDGGQSQFSRIEAEEVTINTQVQIEQVSQSTVKRKSKQATKAQTSSSRTLRNRDTMRVARDKAYFEGYQQPEIHREMTSDEQRMKAYQESIQALVKDKIVLDIGAGSGVLCIMAAKAGASKVIGVEFSEYYQVAIQSIRDNGLGDKVEIVHEMAENFIFPKGKVDILVSEWMGYFLFFENMLPSVIQAKNQNLKVDGLMVPRRASLKIALFDQQKDVQGIILTSLEKVPYNNACIEILKPERVMSDEFTILDVFLSDLKSWSNSFDSKFELTATRSSEAKGIVAWFDTEMSDDIVLSTSPACPATHWKQTLLFFQLSVSLVEGDKFVGNIRVNPAPDDHRALCIEVKAAGPSAKRPFKYCYWLQ